MFESCVFAFNPLQYSELNARDKGRRSKQQQKWRTSLTLLLMLYVLYVRMWIDIYPEKIIENTEKTCESEP